MTKELPMITELHTACLGCIFSIKDKQTQIGCQFNRLEAYRKAGADIVKVYDAHNNEFDVINMRICMYKRGEEWGAEVPKSEREEAVLRELRIKYHAIIYFGPLDSLEGLDRSLMSLENQKNPPRVVSIINKRKDIPQRELVRHISASDYKKIEWRLQTFFDEETENRECVDMVIDNTKNDYKIVFYICFNSGFEVPSVLSQELQKFFVEDMGRAGYAYPTKEGNVELVNSVLHLKHGGNCFNIPIVEKLKEFEEGSEEYILNIEDICPSLKI
jgi:hypothetical protein|tara:strand:+ start:9660 stop:10478 length:819 start_codon:yes stop_codon:yes gene_type:complete